MATLTLLSDTGHHQQQQNGHHHAKKKCTSATCCSPSRIWKSIQQLIADNNKEDLIKLCQDPNRASHVLRVILSSRLTNDASLYPASNKHRVIQLVDDGSSGLSPLHYRATVNSLFGKTATDLNALQLALFHRNENIACYLLQSVRQYAGDKEVKLFVNHLWGTRNGSLHLACFLGMPRVVQLLLEMGVAPDAVNGKLKTPLDCCVDLTAAGSGGQPSILDCRTLIEQALLIKQGKKLSVDSSSPSPSADLCVSSSPEHSLRGTHVDGEVNKNECVVDNKMELQGKDDLDVVDASGLANDAIESGHEEVLVTEVSARVPPSSASDMNGQDELWSLPLLLMDSPFGSGDPFDSDDELWSPPLLIMDSPFDSGDPFVSDDDSFDAGDESWSPPLLIMDNPFGSDPFMCEDDGSDGLTCSMDDVETQTRVLPLPLVVEKCSVRDSGGNGGVALVTGDYSDYGYDGNSSATSDIHSFVDPSDYGSASVSPPTLDGDAPLAGHSSLLFGMNEDPDPKAYGNHQVYSDPGMANVATYLRDPDPTKTAHGSDTSWLSSHHDRTGDTRNRSPGHSFVEQDTNFMSNDWKALRYESTLAERKTFNVIAGANGCVGYEDNPNIGQLLLLIARALHTTARPLPFAPLKPCHSDYRTILGTHGLDHRPSFMAVAGGDT